MIQWSGPASAEPAAPVSPPAVRVGARARVRVKFRVRVRVGVRVRVRVWVRLCSSRVPS